MQFSPKDKQYCGTCLLFNQMNLMVVEDSKGLEKGIEQVHKLIGIRTNSVLKQWCVSNDNIARNKLLSQRIPEVKKY
jgi:hypothetical protein